MARRDFSTPWCVTSQTVSTNYTTPFILSDLTIFFSSQKLQFEYLSKNNLNFLFKLLVCVDLSFVGSHEPLYPYQYVSSLYECRIRVSTRFPCVGVDFFNSGERGNHSNAVRIEFHI